MRKVILTLMAACAIIAAYAQEATEPRELTNAKTICKAQLKTAIEPIVKNYLISLDELNRQMETKGDLAGAMLVKREISSLSANNGAKMAQAALEVVESGTSENSADKEKPASLVRIWNTHNGPWKNKGADKVKVQIFLENKVVFESEELDIKWQEDDCPSIDVNFQENLKFDRVRVNVTKVHNRGGGLADVQVILKGKIISKGCNTAASSVYKTYKGAGCEAANAVDGVTKDAGDAAGYWLLGNAEKPGWIDLFVKSE